MKINDIDKKLIIGILILFVLIAIIITEKTAKGQPGSSSGCSLSFFATPTTIVRGSTASLEWSVTGLEACYGLCDSGDCTGWVGHKNIGSCSEIVRPNSTTVYRLVCAGSQGFACGTATVTVREVTQPSPPPPNILFFTATPTNIVNGQTSTLSWKTQNATSCKGECVSGDCREWVNDKSLTGFQEVRPRSNSTYGLRCTGPGGSAFESVTVGVTTYLCYLGFCWECPEPPQIVNGIPDVGNCEVTSSQACLRAIGSDCRGGGRE
jgi:hypothetical protein